MAGNENKILVSAVPSGGAALTGAASRCVAIGRTQRSLLRLKDARFASDEQMTAQCRGRCLADLREPVPRGVLAERVSLRLQIRHHKAHQRFEQRGPRVMGVV